MLVKGAQTGCIKRDHTATWSGLVEPAVPRGVFCTNTRTGEDGLFLVSALWRQSSRLLMEGVPNGWWLRSFSSVWRGLVRQSRRVLFPKGKTGQTAGDHLVSPKCDKLVSCSLRSGDPYTFPFRRPPILRAHERVSEIEPRFHVPTGQVLLFGSQRQWPVSILLIRNSAPAGPHERGAVRHRRGLPGGGHRGRTNL